MTKTKLNFYCPTATVKVLDEMAAADHRDRTSLLNKIIDFYLTAQQSTQPNGSKPTAAPPTKRYPYRGKAGAR